MGGETMWAQKDIVTTKCGTYLSAEGNHIIFTCGIYMVLPDLVHRALWYNVWQRLDIEMVFCSVDKQYIHDTSTAEQVLSHT
jgi:hypothetical protein